GLLQPPAHEAALDAELVRNLLSGLALDVVLERNVEGQRVVVGARASTPRRLLCNGCHACTDVAQRRAPAHGRVPCGRPCLEVGNALLPDRRGSRTVAGGGRYLCG